MIEKVKIYGERCSGTNYLQALIEKNFDVNIANHIHEYGHKHFFGFENLKKTDNVLFICIVRDPSTWMNSFYQSPWHLHPSIVADTNSFMSNKFYSIYDDHYGGVPTGKFGQHIEKDLNIYTKKYYRNIFELRETKLKWMIETLPTLVRNYLLIRYEDLLEFFDETMTLLADQGLRIKDQTIFPENHYNQKLSNKPYKKNNKINITKSMVIHHLNYNPFYENKLGYV